MVNESRPCPILTWEGVGPSAHSTGRLSSRLRLLARPRMGSLVSTLEPEAGVFAVGGWNSRVCVLQHGLRCDTAAYRPPLALLCRLVPCERRSALQRPANGTRDLHRAGPTVLGACGGRDERWQGQCETGRADLFPRDRSSENRAAMKTKIEPSQSFNLSL